jgi:gamma-glutamylcyclotransferase (GGCT)/AIG2-like uncharacterized protein YtfP
MTLPLFVYGTLRTGESQAPLLGTLERRPAWVRGQLYALPAGYPAVVLGAEGRVHGELVAAPDERLLALLDRYEGVDEGLYERVQCEVHLGLRSALGWVYAMSASRARSGRLVRDGRWRSTRRR